jgi:hypothetical protein
MAFDRLQDLGDEKFGKILNLLMRGEPARRVARMIQQPPPTGWGLFQDIGEVTLQKQVTRLRSAAAKGLAKKAAALIEAGHAAHQDAGTRVAEVIERLGLAEMGRGRVVALIAAEQADPRPCALR